MDYSVRPVIFISKCLGFDHCRYDGQIISDSFIDKLSSFVEFKPVCPEIEIGLGVPRPPIKIYYSDNKYNLIQPETGRDLSKKMISFSRNFLDSINDADGFMLKSRSPSCGLKDVKVFSSQPMRVFSSKGTGFFAQTVKERFPYTAAEDEGRLKNFNIREKFLTQIYTHARFRKAKSAEKLRALEDFHSRHKFLLMAYNQTGVKILGRIIANHEHKALSAILAEYGSALDRCFVRLSRFSSNINVLMHSFGHISSRLTAGEKDFFFSSLEKYRRQQMPLTCLISLMKSWIIRFDEQYLLKQFFFEPYPEGLTVLSDSGKGRI